MVNLPVDRVLTMMAGRDPLPAVYQTPSDPTAVSPGLVGRSHLNMKATSSSDLMQATSNDDG